VSANDALRLVLAAALCAAAWMGVASAASSPQERARAFARLPNFTGIWQSEAWPLDVSGRPKGNEDELRRLLQLIQPPPYNTEWQAKFAAASADTAERARRDATLRACTRNFPAIMEAPYMFEVVSIPEETALIFENDQVRHIRTAGHDHPPADELWPTRLGDSVGHWEGDTLVVDTIARATTEPLAPRAWFSVLSEQAHFIERLRLTNPNELEDQLIIEDPLALAHPWHITFKYSRVTQLDRMVPYDCIENERNPEVGGKLIVTPSSPPATH
jgi:hypothetical protein